MHISRAMDLVGGEWVANTEMREGLKSRVRRGAEDGQTFLLSECTEAGSSGILLRIISDTGSNKNKVWNDKWSMLPLCLPQKFVYFIYEIL